MENNADKLQEQQEKKTVGVPFQKGYDPRRNYEGRPGQTLKEFQKIEFQNMSVKEKREFLAKVDPKTRWAMAEGNPATEHEGEITHKIQVLPSEVIDKNDIQISPEPESHREGQDSLQSGVLRKEIREDNTGDIRDAGESTGQEGA